MESLNTLQSELEGLYELSVAHQVTDFLTSVQPRADAARVQPAEQLLLREDEDGLGLALYLSPGLLEDLARNDPLDRLGRSNLNSFCQALEGVSHFLYVAWRAGYDREMTRLEMELQAEVDKYMTAARLFAGQGDGRVPADLAGMLFGRVSYHAGLAPSEHRRYRSANDYAFRLCAALEHRYARRLPDHPDALRDLRRFYRLGERGKLDWIDSVI